MRPEVEGDGMDFNGKRLVLRHKSRCAGNDRVANRIEVAIRSAPPDEPPSGIRHYFRSGNDVPFRDIFLMAQMHTLFRKRAVLVRTEIHRYRHDCTFDCHRHRHGIRSAVKPRAARLKRRRGDVHAYGRSDIVASHVKTRRRHDGGMRVAIVWNRHVRRFFDRTVHRHGDTDVEHAVAALSASHV